MGIGIPDQFDRVARPDRAAPDHPRHLTRAADHRLERVGVDFEHLAARRPVARDLELSLADAQPRAVAQLHDRDAFDGDVLAQDAGLDRHARAASSSTVSAFRRLTWRRGRPAWRSPSRPKLVTRWPRRRGTLRNCFSSVGVDRDEARQPLYQMVSVAGVRPFSRASSEARTLRRMPLLEGRRALIFGVANRRSIAWAIAQALAREGAELAFTFQGERIEQGVRDLAATRQQSAGRARAT